MVASASVHVKSKERNVQQIKHLILMKVI